jgi:DNA polymerase-3 subunit gamma/tau
MAYQVLARKYRPQFFADVVGQDHVTRTLLNALSQGRVAHGYIFSGHRGIGKTTIARILAMALECRTPQGAAERPTPEPCGVCDACREIRAGNAVDVIEIDAATNRGIDEIRELREGARYRPARDRYKIYILDEAHQITDAAFNALLKTLEEPPEHVVFMMATTQPEDIPQTIRSRCQHFSFHAVRFEDIVGQLQAIAEKEGIGVDSDALSLLAEAGDGSMRDALSIMDQAIASAPLVEGRHVLDATQIRSLMGAVSNQVFERMLEAVQHHDAASMLQQAAQLLDAGNSPQQIARQMVRFLRNCLMARLAGGKSELLQVSGEERARADRMAAIFSEEDLARFLNSMLRTFDDLGYRQEQRFHLELGLLKLVHMQRLLPFEELFRQLAGGPRSAAEPAGRQPASGLASARPQGLTPPAATPKTFPSAPTQTATEAHPLAEIFARAPAAAGPAAGKLELRPEPAVESPSPRASTPAAALEAPQASAGPSGPSTPAIPGAATSAASPQATEDAGAATVLDTPAAPDAEELRNQICAAMIQAGHETAGAMFEAGNWEYNGSELSVRIAASKTLLEMIYTPQAQQIVRENFRRLTGSLRPVRVEPGEAAAASPAREQRKRTAADAAGAASHPLVRRAQELFHAEVRSVVSLRDQR